MKRSSKRILLKIRPSPTVAGFVLAAHLLALAALCICCQYQPLFVVALPLVLASGCHNWSILADSPGGQRIGWIEHCGGGEWRLRDGNGAWRVASLCAGSFVSSWLVVLRFSPGRRWQCRTVILLSSNTDPDQLRWLRIRLLRYGEAKTGYG